MLLVLLVLRFASSLRTRRSHTRPWAARLLRAIHAENLQTRFDTRSASADPILLLSLRETRRALRAVLTYGSQPRLTRHRVPVVRYLDQEPLRLDVGAEARGVGLGSDKSEEIDDGEDDC